MENRKKLALFTKKAGGFFSIGKVLNYDSQLH